MSVCATFSISFTLSLSAVASSDNDSIREGLTLCLTNNVASLSIVAGLSKIFPVDRRSCYLLPTPALDTCDCLVFVFLVVVRSRRAHDSERLISMPEKDINPKFVQRMNALVGEVLPSIVHPKRKVRSLSFSLILILSLSFFVTDCYRSATMQGGSALKGPGYARLVETCVAAMNEEASRNDVVDRLSNR